MTEAELPDFREMVLLTIRGKDRLESKRLALALDVAIAFGAMCQRAGGGGFDKLTDLELVAVHTEKFALLKRLSAAAND